MAVGCGAKEDCVVKPVEKGATEVTGGIGTGVCALTIGC